MTQQSRPKFLADSPLAPVTAYDPNVGFGSIVLQKSKVAAVQILGENLKRKRSMIRIAPVALPKSPINLAQGDDVPQIITRITRQRPSEFLTSPVKRLLQHNLPTADIQKQRGSRAKRECSQAPLIRMAQVSGRDVS